MRNIVEHGQISGSSETMVLSGCSRARRCTMWISVPIASAAPAGAARTHSWMRSVDPTRSATSTTSCAHSGCTMISMPGVLGPGRLDVRAEPLVHRAVALPEQQRRVLDVALLEAAALVVRVPDPHVGLAVAHREAGVAAEVLVGEEEHLVALGEGPLEDRPRVRRRAHRAAVAPTKAFSAARSSCT